MATDSDKQIAKYKKNLEENIFTCIEMLHMSYHDIMKMPVLRFNNLLKWKMKLEADKQKAIEGQKQNG